MENSRSSRSAPPDGDDGLASVRRVYSVWGRHPGLYAIQDMVTFLGRHRTIRYRAVEATGVGRGDRVLDVACGTGRNFPFIEDRIGPAGQLVGYDYSDEMLTAAGRLCRLRGWSNVQLVQGDAATLDVGHEPFDAVVSVLGMSAIPDHVAALERCRDVLRPGGALAVCDAGAVRGALRLLDPLLRAVYTRWAAWNPDRDVPADMRRVFGNASVDAVNFGTLYVATSRRR